MVVPRCTNDVSAEGRRSMRALVSDRHRSVVMSDVPDPEPGAGQVLVAVDSVSVNRGETFQLENPAAGWRPGKDFAGSVVRAAADDSGPATGTRVVGHAPHSSWAERVAVETGRVVALPDSLADEKAAALPLAGLTALRLARLARLSPGMSVLMTGASGGVGHYFAELASMAGASLTAVVGTGHRGTRLREIGAETLTDIGEAGTVFDVGMDSVGGESLAQVRRRVDPRGSIIWFGQASRTPATVDFFDWVDGTAAAPIIQFHYENSDRPLQRDLATLVALAATGKLRPVLDRIRPAEEAATAIEDLRERRILGNLVLKWS
jgi:NADPH:quinone reductase-like Zn-dependent oxidoreductase